MVAEVNYKSDSGEGHATVLLPDRSKSRWLSSICSSQGKGASVGCHHLPFVFETASLASFKLTWHWGMTLNFWSSGLHLQSARITGICHTTWFYIVLRMKSRVSCVKRSILEATIPPVAKLPFVQPHVPFCFQKAGPGTTHMHFKSSSAISTTLTLHLCAHCSSQSSQTLWPNSKLLFPC